MNMGLEGNVQMRELGIFGQPSLDGLVIELEHMFPLLLGICYGPLYLWVTTIEVVSNWNSVVAREHNTCWTVHGPCV